MKIAKTENAITPTDESPRSESVPIITGEGQGRTQSRSKQNDAAASKPPGSAEAETLRSEIVRLRLQKGNLRMGTWNVRGMGIGKLEIVKREMERVGLDLL